MILKYLAGSALPPSGDIVCLLFVFLFILCFRYVHFYLYDYHLLICVCPNLDSVFFYFSYFSWFWVLFYLPFIFLV